MGVVAILAGWAVLFPYTADGDAALHFLNARDMAGNPAGGLFPWARPLFKVIILGPALAGMFAARMAVAVVSAVAVWQTVRLAEDLKLPRAGLAGIFLIAQPFAFALAADTMTEMPMALGVVVALRLWIGGRWGWSGLVTGFLPLVRPEGFFLGVVWGVMVLASKRLGGWDGRALARRARVLALMAVGLGTWALVGWALTADWLLILHEWSWPPESYPGYGHGPIYHYAVAWPYYCGLPLTVLYVAGVRRSANRAMGLPWAVWGVVFAVHSILYWGGWFASCGLFRIMACTAPVTAVVCLYGFNTLADAWARRTGRATRHDLGWRGAVVAGVTLAWAMAQYCAESAHWDGFCMQRCTAYIRANGLVTPETVFFPGNRLTVAQLGLPNDSPKVLTLPAVPEEARRRLYAMPVGAIGVWDNRQAELWHGISIDDLAGEGFTVLFEDRRRTWGADPFKRRLGLVDMRYAVLKKTGEGPVRKKGGLRGGPM
jgi:hypothetical protein